MNLEDIKFISIIIKSILFGHIYRVGSPYPIMKAKTKGIILYHIFRISAMYLIYYFLSTPPPLNPAILEKRAD